MEQPQAIEPTYRDLIVETARAHADTARAAYHSRDREVELLKAQIVLLENALERAKNKITRLIEQMERGA